MFLSGLTKAHESNSFNILQVSCFLCSSHILNGLYDANPSMILSNYILSIKMHIHEFLCRHPDCESSEKSIKLKEIVNLKI